MVYSVSAGNSISCCVGLLDPKWREQKARQDREKKEQETVYDTGVNIEVNLRSIAERRTDIFGVGGEEAEIGKKVCASSTDIMNSFSSTFSIALSLYYIITFLLCTTDSPAIIK